MLFAPSLAQGPAWQGPYSWFPQTYGEIEHAALIGKPGPHQGKVFLARGHISDGIWLWDPAAPSAVEAYPYDNYLDNLSCCGHSWDTQGDLIMSGGDKNTPCGPEPIWSNVLKPDEWFVMPTPTMLLPASPPSRFGYYYPTTLAMHDGRVVSIGGSSAPWRTTECGPEPPNSFVNVNYWQVFNKTALRWEGTNPGFANDQPFAGAPNVAPNFCTFSIYPRAMELSNGSIFVACQQFGGWDPTQSRNYSFSAFASVASWPPSGWTVHPSKLQDAQGNTVNLTHGSAILWPFRIGAAGVLNWDTGLPGGWVDRTLVIAGYDQQVANLQTPFTAADRQAHNTVWEITNPLTANWTIPAGYGAMAHRRMFCNAVITPDLKLIVFGGSENNFCPYDSGGLQVQPIPVYVPEMLDLLNPGAGWQPLSPHASARLYHSVALLLKDGRIMVGSGYKDTVPAGALVHTDAEIFTPPSLQQGLARPSIVNPQSEINDIHYGASIPQLAISLQGAAEPATEIEFATLIRCGSATHHFDADQRCIKLEVTSSAGRFLTLAPLPSVAQGGHFIAPPGYYFLFVVTTPRGNPLVRVPSVARFLRIS